MKRIVATLFSCLFFFAAVAQGGVISGRIRYEGQGVPGATIRLDKTRHTALSDSNGHFSFSGLAAGRYSLAVTHATHHVHTQTITVQEGARLELSIVLAPKETDLSEVVVTGTLKEVSRSQSPVPVEIITPKLFQKNPTPSLFEAVGLVNGVQPQLNCNVCNTGDIHINGMEGPYTMVLIDGMPIVSALSTVYGLNGIPNSLVERIEVVKGPASSLYGSEALGGIINVITKNPTKAPRFSADVFGTTWGELSADAGVTHKAGRFTNLTGINYFRYQNPADHNKDNFTDLTQQQRVSLFSKWAMDRKENRAASLAARYVYEDRWGGELQWNKRLRGSDQVYGESIYTNRAELIGQYQLPLKERVFTQFSYNWHRQNSFYGTTPYHAVQQVAFAQAYWDKALGKRHNALLGAAFRYTFYDDNTPGTASANGTTNKPARTPLPGVFVQDQWTLNDRHTLLAGYRFDYDQHHGAVHSPRVAYKFSPGKNHTVRASFGSGFRVVNLFTEDHAALTGAREVVIKEALNPERSWSSNLNYTGKWFTGGTHLGLDATAFYSYFTNKIIGDFDTDPNKIIYDNLNGYAVSQGISMNADVSFLFPLKILAGVSYMDVYQREETAPGKRERVRQLHAPEWSGTFIGTYTLPRRFVIDLTGRWSGPMRLPVLPNDYRPAYSPWFAIANVQLTKKLGNGLELYGGLKNIFDFVPKDPIMRPFDPFDKTADDVVTNPNGYTFDPTYNYASLQGRRGFVGLRWNLF
jgi:outer membrane receptor for ferrienterochelin and colicins